MIPANRLHELVNLTDDQLDPFIPNSESIAAKYTVGYDVRHGPHIDVVRRQLTRRLPLLTADVYEELDLAMKDNWPVNSADWTTVKAYPTCMKIVSRAANRVFAGTKLCRTPDFLEHSRLYAIAVFKAGGLMRLLPKSIHTIVAPYFTRDVKRHLAICKEIALPEIRERLKHIQSPSYKPSEAPVDALQWILEDCNQLAQNDPTELDEDRLCRRLLMLNMVAIHTTSMVTTDTLLDLFSSPDREDYVAGLREEVERVLHESGGQWSKNAINSMHRVDSTIRETMRVSSLGDIGMKRQVTDPAGIDLSGGLHIPAGVRLATPNRAIHTDPAFYGENASSWDGFRFSKPREAYLEQVTDAGDRPDRLKSVLEQKNQGLIATSSDFLSFGHGRHACPGRFFASQEMKLMLAHIVMNYDIKIDGGRPKNMEINGASVPTNEAEMQIRLRSKTVA